MQSGNGFIPVSITGAARQAVEQNIERYTVFTPFAAYFIAETETLDGCVKLSVDGNKNVRIHVCMHNKTRKTVKTYLAAYMKCHLFHSEAENFEAKWFKSCRVVDSGFVYTVNEQMSRTVCATHYAAIRRSYDGEVQSTVSPSDFCGDSVSGLYAAKSLFAGKILRCKKHCEFTESPIAADMLPLELKAGESVCAEYVLSVSDDLNTAQLYKNLGELVEILVHEKKYADKANEYKATAERIEKGLRKYAINGDGHGNKKIIHGWGDKRGYKVGSYCDNDGQSRDSATSNAFWVLSGLNEKQDMKEHILRAFERLDSKYGIKTFEPYFAEDNDKVGRIIRLPKGTAENAATYIHGTLFAVWSLYKLGEYERAEEQLKKILPLTHEFISTTPFVMPNSYVYNEDRGFDGESMNDWLLEL